MKAYFLTVASTLLVYFIYSALQSPAQKGEDAVAVAPVPVKVKPVAAGLKLSSRTCPFFPEGTEAPGVANFIAHGGGHIEGYTYTNSLEAVRRAIDGGFRFIELDLMTSTDGRLVAVHDWAHFNKITGHAELGDRALSFDEVRARKIHGSFTPLTEVEIEEIFAKNPNIVLVTDKTNAYDQVARAFSFPDRIIMEIFTLADFDRALHAGIRYPMYSVTEAELASEVAALRNFKLIAVPTKLMEAHSEKLRTYVNDGRCVFAFSSNEDAFIKKSIEGALVTHFYTDFWDLKQAKCTAAAVECTTY